MAKVTVPDQHGNMIEVELNQSLSGSAEWCSIHVSAEPGLCYRHGVRFYELHDEEIFEMFGIGAIFYCPRLGCDEIDFELRLMRSSEMDRVGKCLVRYFTNDLPTIVGSELSAVANGIMRNAARLKILFLKQRQLAEKLERSGFFQGGKKI